MREILAARWLKAEFPGPRFDHVASGAVEGNNSVLTEDRLLSTLALLHKIFNRTMEQRVERINFCYDLLDKGMVITLYAIDKINLAKYWARRSTVVLAYSTLLLVAA